VQAKKRSTIIVTKSGIATTTCWWDELTVSESSVLLTAIPEVAPLVVLTVVRARSAEEAQRWFQAINRAVRYSARRFDVRQRPAPELEGPEESH
jgi:hypothetical protein